MVYKITFSIYLYFIVCTQVLLLGQDSNYQKPSVKWNLQQCLDYSDKHNFALNSLRLNKETAAQNLVLSKFAVLPGVTGTMVQSVTNSNNTSPVVGGLQSEASFTSNYGISSSFTLYNGGYLKDDIRQKALSVQSVNLNILQQGNDNTLFITQAYLNILLAKENIIYQIDLLKTSDAELNLGQQQFNAGSIAKVSLIELEAQKATDKYNLVTAQNLQRQNILNLKQLLLLPSSLAFDIAVPDTLIANAVFPSLDTVIQVASENRPEIKNSELNRQISKLDLEKAKTGYLPLISIGASLASGYSDNQSVNYTKQLDNNFYQQIGLTLSIPIFSKAVNSTNVEKAKIGIRQADITLFNTKTVLSQLIEQAYINVLNAQAQYDASLEQLQFTRESYRIATEELKVGAVNLVDLLVQKNLYIQSLQSYISAKYSAALYIRIYNFYYGIPVQL
jgi:outer membrane protein